MADNSYKSNFKSKSLFCCASYPACIVLAMQQKDMRPISYQHLRSLEFVSTFPSTVDKKKCTIFLYSSDDVGQ